jgi:hypothetical protein
VYHEGGGKGHLDEYADTVINDIMALQHTISEQHSTLISISYFMFSEEQQHIPLDAALALGETDGLVVSADGIVHLRLLSSE